MTTPVTAREVPPRELFKLEVPALAVGVGTLGLARYLSQFDVAAGPVLCPLRRMTGVPCPFCGMTTSFSHLAGGRFWESFVASPLGPVLFIGTVIAVVVLVGALLKRRRLELNVSERLRRVTFRLSIVAMLALMLYQTFRIGPLHRFIS